MGTERQVQACSVRKSSLKDRPSATARTKRNNKGGATGEKNAIKRGSGDSNNAGEKERGAGLGELARAARNKLQRMGARVANGRDV